MNLLGTVLIYLVGVPWLAVAAGVPLGDAVTAWRRAVPRAATS